MQTHLINPFQMRMEGVTVNDVPLQLIPLEQRTKEDHSVIHPEAGLHIPMSLKGTMSGWTVRKPTQEEILDSTSQSRVTFVHMTSALKWKPNSLQFAAVEQTLRADLDRGLSFHQKESRDLSTLGSMPARGLVEPTVDAAIIGDLGVDRARILANAMAGTATVKAGVVANGTTTVADTGESIGGNAPVQVSAGLNNDGNALVDNCGEAIYSSERKVTLHALKCKEDYLGVHDIDHYAESLMNELEVTESGMQGMASKLASATTTRKRSGFVGPELLAKNWKIGLEAAKRTVESTTQLAVRDFTNVSGTKRLKPHHVLLGQKRLVCPAYGDVMFGKCKSLRGNTCAYVCATAFHFVRAQAMASKADSHFSLDDFFDKFGSPPV